MYGGPFRGCYSCYNDYEPATTPAAVIPANVYTIERVVLERHLDWIHEPNRLHLYRTDIFGSPTLNLKTLMMQHKIRPPSSLLLLLSIQNTINNNNNTVN